MNTKLIKIDQNNFKDEELAYAVSLLQKGELVAFPTETVYGLGANALSGDACKKIYQAKQRPSDNPLIVHISNFEMLQLLVTKIPKDAEPILNHFWPGPLTVLFQKSEIVPDEVTCGLPTVAIRFPSHPVAKRLIELAGVPVAAPSANLSGRPSGTTGEDVLSDLKGRILCVIDSGLTTAGMESTVIDLNRNPPTILRPGAITLENLVPFIPNVVVYSIEKHANKNESNIEDLLAHPPTPGLKYKHYSPNVKVVLFQLSKEINQDFKGVISRMQEKMHEYISGIIKTGCKIGILHVYSTITFDKFSAQKDLINIYQLGDENHPELVGKGLFKALRDLEKVVDVILMEGIKEEFEGYAVMNRIIKAADETFVIY